MLLSTRRRGLPTKDKKEYPLFDYEKILYDSLMSVDDTFKDKHLWVKKATGLGVTEFMLRLMAWLWHEYMGHLMAVKCA